MDIQTLILGPVNANCYVITDSDETAIIDCGQFTPELDELLKDKNVKYIMLTHGHGDHILGVYDLKQKFPQAKVAIHRLDAPCLEDENVSLAVEMIPGCQKNLSADILLEEGDELNVGSLTFKVLHTPGHSMGSVCFYVEGERTLFTGDTLFCLTVGRTDLYGGNDDEMYNSIKRLYDFEGEYDIYPGHNRATTMEYEKRRNRYMRKFK